MSYMKSHQLNEPRQHHIEEIFSLLLLFEVVSCSSFDQSLEVVCVLLHAREKIVKQVATAVTISTRMKTSRERNRNKLTLLTDSQTDLHRIFCTNRFLFLVLFLLLLLLKRQNLPHMSLQYGKLRPTSG